MVYDKDEPRKGSHDSPEGTESECIDYRLGLSTWQETG